jgi:hypothetical protein
MWRCPVVSQAKGKETAFNNIITVLTGALVITFAWLNAADADNCSSVIPGASTSGYNGTYGSYDEDGNCHARGGNERSGSASVLTESDCRQLTGNLYIDFSGDHGKNFTHCVFRVPTGSSDFGGPITPGITPKQPGPGECPSGYKWCEVQCIPDDASCCANGRGFYCEIHGQCVSATVPVDGLPNLRRPRTSQRGRFFS